MGVFYVIINACLFVMAFLRHYKRRGRFDVGSLLLFIYSIGSIFSVVYYLSDNYYREFRDITLFPFLYLFLLLYISFQPVIRFKSEKVESILSPYLGFLDMFSIFLIIVSLIGLVKDIPNVLFNYAATITDINNLFEVYTDTMYTVQSQTGHSFKNIIPILSSMFSEIILFFFFYYLTLNRKNKFILIGLGISSLYSIVSAFSLGLRSSLIWFVFDTTFLYILFKIYMSSKIAKIIRVLFVALLSIISIAFITITIGRFTSSGYNDDDVLNSIIEYSGQPFLYFNEYVLNSHVYQYGDNTAPLFRRGLGLETSDNILNRQAKWDTKMGIHQGAFYTFVGDICFDYGPFFAVLIIVLISIIFSRNSMPVMSIPLKRLFLLYFSFCISANGIFYFSYKTVGGNLKIIAYILVYIMLIILDYKKYNTRNVNAV